MSHFSFPLSIYLSSSVPFLHLFLLPYFLLSPLWSFHFFIVFSSHSSLISFILPLLSLSFFPPCIPVFPLLSSHLSLSHSLPFHSKKFSPSILHVLPLFILPPHNNITNGKSKISNSPVVQLAPVPLSNFYKPSSPCQTCEL